RGLLRRFSDRIGTRSVALEFYYFAALAVDVDLDFAAVLVTALDFPLAVVLLDLGNVDDAALGGDLASLLLADLELLGERRRRGEADGERERKQNAIHGLSFPGRL